MDFVALFQRTTRSDMIVEFWKKAYQHIKHLHCEFGTKIVGANHAIGIGTNRILGSLSTKSVRLRSTV